MQNAKGGQLRGAPAERQAGERTSNGRSYGGARAADDRPYVGRRAAPPAGKSGPYGGPDDG